MDAYTSVMGWGQVQRLKTVEARTVALRLFARKYASMEKAEALKERTVVVVLEEPLPV